jgi:drug/metabolite transporter (DMT)-like permease
MSEMQPEADRAIGGNAAVMAFDGAQRTAEWLSVWGCRAMVIVQWVSVVWLVGLAWAWAGAWAAGLVARQRTITGKDVQVFLLWVGFCFVMVAAVTVCSAALIRVAQHKGLPGSPFWWVAAIGVGALSGAVSMAAFVAAPRLAGGLTLALVAASLTAAYCRSLTKPTTRRLSSPPTLSGYDG